MFQVQGKVVLLVYLTNKSLPVCWCFLALKSLPLRHKEEDEEEAPEEIEEVVVTGQWKIFI